MKVLSIQDYEALAVLSEVAGFLTGSVARRVSGAMGRKHSASIRQRLLLLQKDGLVKTLDDQSPVAWMRTPSGSAALEWAAKRGIIQREVPYDD